MEDIGFSGSGSRFNSRFEAGSPITAKQLNSLADGIQASLPMPYLGDGVSVSFTPGGSLITGIGGTYSKAATKILPWTVQTYSKPKEDEEGVDWFLQVARGVCNYTWSQFPFKPATTGPIGIWSLGKDGCKQFQNEAIMADIAVYPAGSYVAGDETDGTTPWMGQSPKSASIKITNAAEGGNDIWHVTVSKVDWWDKELWYQGDRLIEREMPFVSVVEDNDPGGSTILGAETQNSQSHRYVILPYPQGVGQPATSGPYNNGFVIPRNIGYNVKKIATLNWNAENENWDVTQYILHQAELQIQYQEQTRWVDFIFDYVNYNWYDLAVYDHFDSDPGITNLELLDNLKSIAGYEINLNEWWVHVVNHRSTT